MKTKRRYIVELTKAELDALEHIATIGLNTEFDSTFAVKQDPRLYKKADKGISQIIRARHKGLKTIK